MFDVEGQIGQLFDNFKSIRFGAFFEWNFYEDFTFYAIVGLIGWLVLTLILFKTMKPLDEYSMIENINPKIGWLKVIAINYCVRSRLK